MRIEPLTFTGASGALLDARLKLPASAQIALAIFAYCFSRGKGRTAAVRIARALAARGVGVLRFAFNGLGESEGDFSDTNSTSNVGDIVVVSDYLRTRYEAPALLVGHSFGGAAVIAAASALSEVWALATIGVPSDFANIAHHLEPGAQALAA